MFETFLVDSSDDEQQCDDQANPADEVVGTKRAKVEDNDDDEDDHAMRQTKKLKGKREPTRQDGSCKIQIFLVNPNYPTNPQTPKPINTARRNSSGRRRPASIACVPPRASAKTSKCRHG